MKEHVHLVVGKGNSMVERGARLEAVIPYRTEDRSCLYVLLVISLLVLVLLQRLVSDPTSGHCTYVGFPTVTDYAE
jgi:hypothetical protein